MIAGIGIDLLCMERLQIAINAPYTKQNAFVRRTYTQKELELAEKRSNPENFLATRFAGKEAVLKALVPNGEAVSIKEIEILSKECGQPVVFLHGKAKQIQKRKQIHTIHISLSYDGAYASAYVICEK